MSARRLGALGVVRYLEARAVPGDRGQDLDQPVLVGDVLLVRNGQEMAAFRLALAGR